MQRTKWAALAVAMAITAAACGGDDDSGDQTETIDDTQEAQVETPPLPPADNSDDADDSDQSSGGDAGIPVPIARFAAHGPEAVNTIGPGCAVGIDNSGGDVFRFTPPATWTWQGTSGGSSYDQVTLNADEVRMVVTEAAYDYDTEVIREWLVIGPAGAEIEIDGVTIPIMEVSVEGSGGYAIVDVDYMSPMPALTPGASLGTVALTSSETDRPTLDEAEQLLGSVRIERCAAVGEAMIWGPGGGARLVPRFDPDPLGKTYPDQPQPAYVPTITPLDSYTLEQVAYLMPVEADVALCAAEKAVEFGAGNPVAYLFMFSPTGTNKEDLDAIVAQC